MHILAKVLHKMAQSYSHNCQPTDSESRIDIIYNNIK